jgi:trehalose 2-sulfotransferase
MHLYENQFSEVHDFPHVEVPSKVLVIASTARCGSHMLGHALHQTGKFGFPLEYANPVNLGEWRKRLEIDDFQQVMTEIQRRRTSPNGVFGIKIHYPHLQQFGGFENLCRFFPDAHYVILSRKDVLSQAVSHSIASQTGVWIAGQEPVNDDPKYDFDHIDRCLRQALINTASWRYTLAASGCNCIEMDFDQVRRDPAASIQEIARFIDIQIDAVDIPQEQVTTKQGSNRNAEWANRFISEFNKSRELVDDAEPGLVRRLKAEVKRMMRA